MVNFGPLAAEIGWRVRLASLGHPSKFQRVSLLGFVTAETSLNGSQPNFARCLAVSWAGTLYIHFWVLWRHNGILPGVKFTLHPSFALSYIGSVTARHSSSGYLRRGTRNGIMELSQRAPPMFGRAAIKLGIDPHSSLLIDSAHSCHCEYFMLFLSIAYLTSVFVCFV